MNTNNKGNKNRQGLYMNIERLLPQKMLHKTIEKKRLNRIQEYTFVADALEPEFAGLNGCINVRPSI